MDTELIEHQIQGLITKGKGLREQEKIFLKVSGIEESVEKYKQEVVELETDITAKKEDLAELKSQKAEAVKSTLIAMQDKLSELLPMGDGIVHINDDRKFIIGWLKPGKSLVPYEGLSGGEKVLFGNALGSALLSRAINKMLIIEAAEVDDKNIVKQLNLLEKVDKNTQVIVSTCHRPKAIPKSFNIIEL